MGMTEEQRSAYQAQLVAEQTAKRDAATKAAELKAFAALQAILLAGGR